MFGPDDAFLTTILKLLRQLPVYPMFGRGVTRLQPAYVDDVAEAIGRTMQRAGTPSTIFEFGDPRVYSYEELLRAVAHQAGLAPRLIPIPLAVWHALAWASEMLPSPRLTRNQVELMQIDTVSSPEFPGFSELEISQSASKDDGIARYISAT
jgi:nucleoside-diphosphate-sugar epimerase